MLECLVHTDVIVSPTEMTGSSRFHAAPVLPVMAFTEISSVNIRFLASGSRPSWIQVANNRDWPRALPYR